VDNPHTVAIGNCREDLLHNDGCISLRIVGALDDLVEELTSTAVFCNDKVTLGILVHFK
jgi:hypothetical protein